MQSLFTGKRMRPVKTETKVQIKKFKKMANLKALLIFLTKKYLQKFKQTITFQLKSKTN